MPGSYFILIPLLAVLSSYLFWSVRRRWLKQETERQLLTGDWQPTAFDASKVTPRLENLRKDYAGAAHQRAQVGMHARQERLVGVAHAIHWLPYFCRLREESSADDAGAVLLESSPGHGRA